MYGNYDGKNSVQKNSPLLFDLHIRMDPWGTVNISDPSTPFTYEIIAFIAANNWVSVCLIRTGSSSTPFISSLELRPMKETFFSTFRQSFFGNPVSVMRRNLGARGDKIIRYPDDPYDRIWEPMNITLHELSTTKAVERNKSIDEFEVPSVVLQTASVSASVNDSIRFRWHWDFKSDMLYYFVFHFSELELLPKKDVREFNVYIDDYMYRLNYTPTYLKSGFVHGPHFPLPSQNVSILNATKRATRPPLLNAFEIYTLAQRGRTRTNVGDVEAMLKIKNAYKLKKNWVGDPCLPENYTWDGLSCIANNDHESRITAINLSSSGLVGPVSTSFSSLSKVLFLDLSYNNLSGKIPDSLAMMPHLGVLNLTGNCITEVPKGLLEKSKDGSLILRFDNNTNTCGSNPTPGGNPTPSNNSTTITKKKISTPVIVVLSVVPAILLLVVVVLIFWRIKRKTQAGKRTRSDVEHKDNKLPFESRQFMYTELENITKKFSHTLGKGGFGTVFHGSVEDGMEVAVKICSLSSEQAPNLFLAEIENLSRVHHKNLVTLVGYCMDRGRMAVIYEYMPLGSLEDHLRGKAGNARALSWPERLQIAVDTAQGLDYLHNGMPMPIIHRDIKTSNILLGQNLEVKVSDFGLAKAFHSDLQTHVSMTALAFSPGYIDPMCLETWKFNEKTDVYSFGVVLLELITGEPPIRHDRDVQIIENVQLSFEAGDINAIVDARLQGMYDTESVWKVTELAMNCTTLDVDHRPKMPEVVMQLRESLERETTERSKSMTTESQGMPFMKESTTFGPSAR
ncbi:probable LRR receptor-like serine/threonine-protein kinase PAM74 [Typha latifolia]|uniref:probable LRR receptor-like serine/threonine-protein kinase PAM74 n=1 Tax=Typha latifolia TaxID=4733 RepID=UPI003C2E5283